MGDCLTSLTVMANKQSCQPFCNPTTHTHAPPTQHPTLNTICPKLPAQSPPTSPAVYVCVHMRVCACVEELTESVCFQCVYRSVPGLFLTHCTVGQDCVLVQFQRTTLYTLSHLFLLYDVTNWTSHVHPYVTHLS